MNEIEPKPVTANTDFSHENLALGLTAVTPLLIWLHYYRLSTDSYAIGEVERLIFPAYAVMLLTATFGFYLAYHSPYHKSLVTIAARLLGMLSLTIVALVGLMLYVLNSGFGPA